MKIIKYLVSLLVFIIVWILGCWIQDAYLNIDIESYLMLWGAIVYIVGDLVASPIKESAK